jgi:hypothetical protein
MPSFYLVQERYWLPVPRPLRIGNRSLLMGLRMCPWCIDFVGGNQNFQELLRRQQSSAHACEARAAATQPITPNRPDCRPAKPRTGRVYQNKPPVKYRVVINSEVASVA